MRWVVVVLAVAVVLVALDRAVAHGWGPHLRLSVRTRPHDATGGSAGPGLLGDLVEIFQPNHVHLVAEQERQRVDVVRPGDGDPPAARAQDLPVHHPARPLPPT